MVTAVPVELRGGAIQSQSDFIAQHVASVSYRLANDFQCRSVRGQVGRKAALVSDRRGEPSAREHFFQVMKNFGAHPQCLGEAPCRHGLNHELLNIHIVIGVLPPVKDIHHGYRQRHSGTSRELGNVLIKRLSG